MRITIVLSVISSIVAINPTHAQRLDEQCRERGFFLKKMDEVEKAAIGLDKAVETVPPVESEYIRKEGKLALEQNNSRRYSVIASSRYYTALQFHDDMNVAIDNIAAAKNAPSLKNAAVYLSVVVAKLGDASGSMSNYIESDARRKPPVLADDDRKTLYFGMPLTRDAVLRLLQCAVGSL